MHPFLFAYVGEMAELKMHASFGIAAIVIACASGAVAQESRKTPDDRPRDLSSYSLRYWPHDSLRFGQRVSAETPYGTLTCMSKGRGKRICSLK